MKYVIAFLLRRIRAMDKTAFPIVYETGIKIHSDSEQVFQYLSVFFLYFYVKHRAEFRHIRRQKVANSSGHLIDNSSFVTV